jgi:hypothetical protein
MLFKSEKDVKNDKNFYLRPKRSVAFNAPIFMQLTSSTPLRADRRFKI